MTRTLHDLSKFREEPAPPVEKRRIEVPHHLDWVLAFDPSVTHLGWFRASYTGAFEADTIKPPEYPTVGAWQTFDRSQWVEQQVDDLVRSLGGEGVVVFESPPAQRMMRTESTWIGGHIIYSAARRYNLRCVMVHRQSVYATVYGHGNAKKAQAHAWLRDAYDPEYFTKVKNEHERDAMMMADYACQKGL